MLWFNHPKQVGSRKPVAVLVQQQADPVPTSLVLDVAPLDPASLREAGIPVKASDHMTFSVRYALPEYVSFMWQHAGYLIRRRRIGVVGTYYLLAKSTLASALNFVAQGRARRTYDFSIDQHGIVRSAAGGVTLIGWDDVSAIRTYARGYLMVLKAGTLPIPFRCLSGAQSSQMVVLAAWLRARA
jgi:hypothetical protein